jgi:hypothetical protein
MATRERKRIRIKKNTDLSESPDDKKHLQPDEGTLNLPDVKDIPGQEHVRPKLAGEIADAHIASKDEELSDLEIEDRVVRPTDTDSNVSAEEKELLKRSSESMATPDDEKLRQSAVDDIDEDGERLNENIGLSGKDLDVPGAEDDDADESIGEEDEENNTYSQESEREDLNNGKV